MARRQRTWPEARSSANSSWCAGCRKATAIPVVGRPVDGAGGDRTRSATRRARGAARRGRARRRRGGGALVRAAAGGKREQRKTEEGEEAAERGRHRPITGYAPAIAAV